MEPVLVAILKLSGGYAGEKSAEGLFGWMRKWRRNRRIKKLLASDEVSYDKGIESAISGLAEAGEIEIQVFRVVCAHAAKTANYRNGHDPVRLDAAAVFEDLQLDPPKLEQVLLTLQGGHVSSHREQL